MDDQLAMTAATAAISALATQTATAVAGTVSKALSRWRSPDEVTRQLEEMQLALEEGPNAQRVVATLLRSEFQALLDDHPESTSAVHALVRALSQSSEGPQVNSGSQSQTGSASRDQIQIQHARDVTIGRDQPKHRRGWRR
ncbi:hypothetical protein [Actinomadura rubrisoli]|uniref:Uncharacterized protein n=1 Tax=Actinomadura rubrisoli TaxID=2530368 RepID=A0A4R5C3I0_9ACTN|nr:hypothetical protein [Actinomadura rubrisoli]TDD94158.1 hypothetical protein E1298_07555 [Actinomadura rubrisoli]